MTLSLLAGHKIILQLVKLVFHWLKSTLNAIKRGGTLRLCISLGPQAEHDGLKRQLCIENWPMAIHVAMMELRNQLERCCQ